MLTCYRCARPIKGECVHHVPPVLHERLGIDFCKTFHPSCYAKQEEEAGKELARKDTSHGRA